MMSRICYILTVLVFLLASCAGGHPDVPQKYVEGSSLPLLYPDYTDVVLPSNIASPTFMVDDKSVEEVVAEVNYDGKTETFGRGRKVIIGQKDWNVIRDASIGQSIEVTLYTLKSGAWTKHPAFSISIAEDDIDPWVSYRLIEPSYVTYNLIELSQRSLTDYEEITFADNRATRLTGQTQCLNCHSYQNYKTDNMLYHVRGKGGGTMLKYKGNSRLMTELKQEGMISNPVYPSWHPTLPLIAFSANKTGQLFHTQDPAKVEVQDTESHLALYDIEKDLMIAIDADSTDLETFPTWTPDGKRIYYTSAHVEENTQLWMTEHYKDLHYDLYYRDFSEDSHSFGSRNLVLNMSKQGKSATLPRVSPDGKYLAFASGEFGCFHIWHRDADINVLNLESMIVDTVPAVNSTLAESYPTWSSNGRWLFFASRREDGNYSRIYISYFDREGKAHKAFALPQPDPEYGRLLMRSYNRPEPMTEPVELFK